MRTYNPKTNLGGGSDSIISTKMGAGEQNSLFLEGAASVERAGLTTSNAAGVDEETNQLAQSLFLHGAKSQSFNDSGVVNAIVLSPVSGANGVLVPTNYDNMSGVRAVFVPSATNTGNLTINIGQAPGSQLGVKSALNIDGTQIAAGAIVANQFADFIYSSTADGGNGAWLSVSVAGVNAQAVLDITAGQITADTGILISTTAGNAEINIESDPEFIIDTMGTALVGAGGITITDDDTNDQIIVTGGLPAGYITGFVTSRGAANPARAIDVTAGSARSVDDAFNIVGEAQTKNITNAFGTGTGGGRFAGVALTPDTQYWFFAIRRASDGGVEYGFDDNSTAANIPGGYNAYRMLSTLLTEDASNLINSMQGNYTSDDLTVVATGSVILAHGLGTADLDLSFYLVCIMASQGYSVGDVMALNPSMSDNHGQSVRIDATDIRVRFNNESQPFLIINAFDGSSRGADTGNFQYRVQASRKPIFRG